MHEFLPQGLREAMDMARLRTMRRNSRLHLQVGDAVFPILRLWSDGVLLASGFAPRQLRGLVDVYDGPRHLMQCLIVASEFSDTNELLCYFKRATKVCDRAPVDYWLGENVETSRLPKI